MSDVTQAGALLHGKETDGSGDAGYQGVEKREELKDSEVRWHVAMRPGKRRTLDANRPLHQLQEDLEKLTASVRAKVEHPFRVIKQQFGYTKTRYGGLAKNTARVMMLFAMSNLWMSRKRLMEAQG